MKQVYFCEYCDFQTENYELMCAHEEKEKRKIAEKKAAEAAAHAHEIKKAIGDFYKFLLQTYNKYGAELILDTMEDWLYERLDEDEDEDSEESVNEGEDKNEDDVPKFSFSDDNSFSFTLNMADKDGFNSLLKAVLGE